MDGKTKIAVLGGDHRQYYAACQLCECGWDVRLWGLEKEINVDKRIVACEELAQALCGATAVVLPLPAANGDNMLNCPLNFSKTTVSLNYIFSQIERDVTVIGGRIPKDTASVWQGKGIKIYDYFDSENFQIRNAYTTAEAALSIAMNNLNKEIREAKAAITGYGRIAKHLCNLLHLLGADITVAARRESDLAWCEQNGYKVLNISSGASALSELLHGYDVIFNTVPFWLFDRAFLEKVDKSTVLIELASAPGGIDVCAAKDLSSNVLWAPSLPGKYAPESAGTLIAQCVNEFLLRRVSL